MAISKKPAAARHTQERVHEQIARPTAADSKRLNVPVPPDLYRRMKHQSAEEDRSIAEITRELWRRYLAGHDLDE
jgi:hypothetical protein